MQPIDWIFEKARDCSQPANWRDDEQRERSIIRLVSPIYIRAGRAVTLELIRRLMKETAGLNTFDTGRKLHGLVDADLADPATH